MFLLASSAFPFVLEEQLLTLGYVILSITFSVTQDNRFPSTSQMLGQNALPTQLDHTDVRTSC